MPGVAYVDSSALLKLVVVEPETPALEADLAEREGLVASRLATLECGRAVRRAAGKRLLGTTEQVLDSLYLLEITQAILERAASLAPPTLRSLDAIHLATALSLGESDLDVITYDDRLAEAVRAAGVRVVQPGRATRATSGTSSAPTRSSSRRRRSR